MRSRASAVRSRRAYPESPCRRRPGGRSLPHSPRTGRLASDAYGPQSPRPPGSPSPRHARAHSRAAADGDPTLRGAHPTRLATSTAPPSFDFRGSPAPPGRGRTRYPGAGRITTGIIVEAFRRKLALPARHDQEPRVAHRPPASDLRRPRAGRSRLAAPAWVGNRVRPALPRSPSHPAAAAVRGRRHAEGDRGRPAPRPRAAGARGAWREAHRAARGTKPRTSSAPSRGVSSAIRVLRLCSLAVGPVEALRPSAERLHSRLALDRCAHT
jgi:hypothetical protein